MASQSKAGDTQGECTLYIDDPVQESSPLQGELESSSQTPSEASIWISEVPSTPELALEPSPEPPPETELDGQVGEIKILEERRQCALGSPPKPSGTPGTAMADIMERMEVLEQQIRHEREFRVLREQEYEEERRLRLEQSPSESQTSQTSQTGVDILGMHKAEYAAILASKEVYYERRLRLEHEISTGALERQAVENEKQMANLVNEYEEKVAGYESQIAQTEERMVENEERMAEYEAAMAENEARMAEYKLLTAQAEERMVEKENELACQVKDFDAERERLNSFIHAHQEELEERTTANEGLQENLREFKSWVTDRFSLLHSSITPRIIMLAQLAGREASLPDDGKAEEAEKFRQSCALGDLTADLLDMPLADHQLTRFMEVNFGNSTDPPCLNIQVCACCDEPKFTNGPNSLATGISLDEFYRTGQGIRPLTPCSHIVCSACLLRSIETSLVSGWFSHLDRSMWFMCPTMACGRFLAIAHVADLGNVLLRLGSHDVKGLIARHERVAVFRSALKALENRPTPASLEMAANLHNRLISQNVMKSFFDPCLQSLHPDEDGRLPPLNAGPIRMFRVDNPSGTTDNDGVHSIPIFMRLLRRNTSTNGRWCNGCCEPRFEIDCGTADEWAEVCGQFDGDWMWRILVFPEKLADACGHDPDHCSDCLANHIKAKLEELGRNVADNLPCPTENCNRTLSYSEIKLYADKEAFEKYDSHLLLKSMSKNPNFRWCIQGSCDNGELYEDEDERIRCGACNFEMCYRHQLPWHDGFTCDEYDSQREHGDPSFSHTQDWLDENTKVCPGPDCGVNITKGDGCFHMTCRSCDYEFCWECLADWDLIWDREMAVYDNEEHKEGCFFRTSHLTPTEIMGTNLNEALENA